MERFSWRWLQGSGNLGVEFGKAGKKLRFGVRRTHRFEESREITDRQVGLAEQFARFRNRKACKRGRLEIGRLAVGDLDAALEILSGFGGQAEADEDSALEARLNPLVIAANRRLE